MSVSIKKLMTEINIRRTNVRCIDSFKDWVYFVFELSYFYRKELSENVDNFSVLLSVPWCLTLMKIDISRHSLVWVMFKWK